MHTMARSLLAGLVPTLLALIGIVGAAQAQQEPVRDFQVDLVYLSTDQFGIARYSRTFSWTEPAEPAAEYEFRVYWGVGGPITEENFYEGWDGVVGSDQANVAGPVGSPGERVSLRV